MREVVPLPREASQSLSKFFGLIADDMRGIERRIRVDS